VTDALRAAVSGLGGAVFYLLISGAGSATVRAFIMIAISAPSW
jgi:hypothetical protein